MKFEEKFPDMEKMKIEDAGESTSPSDLLKNSRANLVTATGDDNLREIFRQIKPSKKSAVINYGASWCGVCSEILPAFFKLSSKFRNQSFVYADIDECPKTTQHIRYTPTFDFHRGGERVDEMLVREKSVCTIASGCTPEKSIEFEGGNGGPGSIKKVSYFDQGGEVKCMKHRVDEVDEANLVYKFTIIEGENIGTDFESVTSLNKVSGGADGGCVMKVTTTYHTKGDNKSVIEESIKKAKDGLTAFFQAAAAHLHSNPNEYN